MRRRRLSAARAASAPSGARPRPAPISRYPSSPSAATQSPLGTDRPAVTLKRRSHTIMAPGRTGTASGGLPAKLAVDDETALAPLDHAAGQRPLETAGGRCRHRVGQRREALETRRIVAAANRHQQAYRQARLHGRRRRPERVAIETGDREGIDRDRCGDERARRHIDRIGRIRQPAGRGGKLRRLQPFAGQERHQAAYPRTGKARVAVHGIVDRHEAGRCNGRGKAGTRHGKERPREHDPPAATAGRMAARPKTPAPRVRRRTRVSARSSR